MAIEDGSMLVKVMGIATVNVKALLGVGFPGLTTVMSPVPGLAVSSGGSDTRKYTPPDGLTL
jgi:hypothetical protein